MQTNATSPDITEAACSLKLQLDHFGCELAATSVNSETSVGWIYYHATSIYLSGLFDYILSGTGCIISLTGAEVKFHTVGLLSRTKIALRECSVSSLLLLLPLRIAGNRCNTPTEFREVIDQLTEIERVFAITSAFKRELQQIWHTRAAYS